MDRGETVLADHALADEDRILEVVAVPRHERDHHVLAERELAQIGRGAVGHHISLGDALALLNDGPLVDVGVLVRARVLRKFVNIYAHVACHGLVIVHTHHDAVGIDVVDHAAAQGDDAGARIDRGSALDAGADQRLLRAQAGHGLALHVGAHQRAVRVIVLEERNQRCRHRDDLRGRHVHVLHFFRRFQLELVLEAARHQRVGELEALVERGVRLGDDVIAFLDRRKVVDLVGRLAVLHLAVGRLKEAVPVGARIERERIDQADVRAFRRLDRAYPAVVRRVNVAHLEAGSLPGEAARSKGRDAALVRDLGQGIGLVHELRELGRAEELLDGGRDRLGVDQVVRHQVFRFRLAQSFLDGAFHADQPGAELVLGQLAHRAHAAVAEVVDVVDLAAAVAQLDEYPDHFDDVLGAEREARLDAHLELLLVDALALEVVEHLLDHGLRLGLGGDAFQADLVERELGHVLEVGAQLFLGLLRQADAAEAQLPAGLGGRADAAVELHAADRREVIALLGEEQAVEQRLDRVFRRRLAGAHHAVDRDARRVHVRGFVGTQRLRNVRALVQIVGEQSLDAVDLGLAQLREQRLGDLVVGIGDDLAGVLVDHVVRERAAEDELVGRADLLQPRRLHVADVLHRDALVLRHQRLALPVVDVEARHLAAQALRHHLELDPGGLDVERIEVEELGEDPLGRVAERLEQDGHRHLAAPVDAEEHDVLRVELEVEPRAAVRNDARREQELAAGVRLAAVVLEEHARRAVQLRHDDALGAVDDERAGGRHERDLAHVDLLLLHLFRRRLGRLLVHDHQAHLGAQWAGVCQAALLAFLDVERRLAQRVADELEPRILRMADDREDRGERCLQALVPAALGRHMRLQERGIGLELGRDQERHFLHDRPLGEALADAFTLGQRIGHEGSWPRQRGIDKGKAPKLEGLCFVFGISRRGLCDPCRAPKFLNLLT